ncbi:MAG TPA: hypothetical protein VFJ51_00840 [Nitrososphaeraceae archaeon]|nr:hypothetical protein [Nitrososphaeraceae archaeon]
MVVASSITIIQSTHSDYMTKKRNTMKGCAMVTVGNRETNLVAMVAVKGTDEGSLKSILIIVTIY